MGNRSHNQQVHHHPNTVSGSRTTKTFFLPIFCRLSINDVSKPAKFPSSLDPSSPKISCIGQIKKRSNSTGNHNLTATTTSAGKSGTNFSYTKLRKLFSGKNLISPPVDHGSKCLSSRNRSFNGSWKKKHVISIEDRDAVRGVVAVELDPPLPVVKFHRQVKVNLGKRRGIELKTLQIQQYELSTVRSPKIIDNRNFRLVPPPS